MLINCPNCGCQNIVGVVKKVTVQDIKAHPLDENISEGSLILKNYNNDV